MLGGSWLVLGCVLAGSHCRRNSVVHRRRLSSFLVRNAHHRQLLRETGLKIPEAVDFSNTEKCQWLVVVIEQLWPLVPRVRDHAVYHR